MGYLLSVHEGPQSIRQRPMGRETPLAPGMITSDEPGVYFDGAYGIRLENLLLCVEKSVTPFGTFLGFETLTLTPFDLDAVCPAQLTPRERTLLNAYHARVREALSPTFPQRRPLGSKPPPVRSLCPNLAPKGGPSSCPQPHPVPAPPPENRRPGAEPPGPPGTFPASSAS